MFVDIFATIVVLDPSVILCNDWITFYCHCDSCSPPLAHVLYNDRLATGALSADITVSLAGAHRETVLKECVFEYRSSLELNRCLAGACVFDRFALDGVFSRDDNMCRSSSPLASFSTVRLAYLFFII